MLETFQITKNFGATRALDGIDFSVRLGEIHALVGQNGAGKSTLVKIMSGALRPDAGKVRLDGHTVQIGNPHHALRLGISIVHQHSGLVPSLTVAENIFLGRMPTTKMGLVDWERLRLEATALLGRLDFQVDPNRLAESLDAASQQVIEIARALSISARVLILDEPSAVLGTSELERLFDILRKLRAEGKAIVFVSHRLREVFEICDRATVLRDGRSVGTYVLGETVDASYLIRKMVGQGWEDRATRSANAIGHELLRVEKLSRTGAFEDVNLNIRSGEIVGLAGLVGSGRTDICKAIFGAMKVDRGGIFVKGRPVRIQDPIDAVKRGIAFLPKDRHGESLILSLPLGWNVTLPVLERFTSGGILNSRREGRHVDSLVGRLGVRATGPHQPAFSLSGGNQQKVALAKWLGTQASIFLLDEPTAGVDVAAKSQIHELVRDLARSGAAVLLSSSEIPEILAMSSRILVMNKGRVAGRLETQSATEQDVLRLAT